MLVWFLPWNQYIYALLYIYIPYTHLTLFRMYTHHIHTACGRWRASDRADSTQKETRDRNATTTYCHYSTSTCYFRRLRSHYSLYYYTTTTATSNAEAITASYRSTYWSIGQTNDWEGMIRLRVTKKGQNSDLFSWLVVILYIIVRLYTWGRMDGKEKPFFIFRV